MKNLDDLKPMTFPESTRAVLYARVSGDDRGKEGRNLAGQIEMGRDYCAEKNYNPVAELQEDDRGASGAEIDLPQLNKIREMAHAGEFDVLVVREIDRLSRNLAKQLIVEQELQAVGVRIEYVLGEYPDTPEGNLQKHIKGAIAEYEREKIKERMVRGKRNKAKAGKVIRVIRPPFGYAYEGDTFVIVESQARIVREIFRMCLEGMGMMGIATELNRLGVPTTGGGKFWRPSSVRVILTNRTYTGVWEYGKSHWRGKKLVSNPEEYRVEVSVPAIIDLETFNQAQAQLKANFKLGKRNTKQHYLMGRRITCQCGVAVVGYSCQQGKFKYYRCNAKYNEKVHGRSCALPVFRAVEVDDKVWSELTEYVHNPQKLKDGLIGYQQQTDETTKPLRDRLKSTEDLITHWQEEWDNTAANLRAVKSEKAKAVFGEELARIEKTVKELEKEKAATLTLLEKLSLTDAQIQTTLEFAQQMADDWEEISKDPVSRRMLIDMLDVRLMLMVTPEGKRRGLLNAKLPGEPKELLFDDSTS